MALDPRYAEDGPIQVSPASFAQPATNRRQVPVVQQGKSDPNMLNTADTSDELSPTTIVLNYLKSKGLQPNAENIRRTVEANARDPGVLGPNLVGNVGSGGRDIELRNAATEDTPMAAAMRKAMAPAGVVDAGQWDTSGGKNTSAAPPAVPNSPILRAPDGPSGGPSLPPTPTPPVAPSPVGVPPVPQVPPPPAGAAATVPPPADPTLTNAITTALDGPPSQLALPAPSPQLALPAPETPVRPQIAAPPEVPRIAGPPSQLALPAPSPQVETPLRAPPISPANPVVQTPATRAIPRILGGALGGARGGPVGAVLGGATAAIPELRDLGAYIAKNLHLR